MQNRACHRKGHVTSLNQSRGVSSKIDLRMPWLLGTLVITLAGITQAYAQSDAATVGAESRPKIHYQISPQPLNTALRDFALASGLQVSFADDIALDRTSREVAGSYTPEEALSELLAGTGLSFRFTTVDTVTLERTGPSIVPLAPAIKNQNVATAADNGQGGTPASVKPIVVPEIVVKDVHERNEPDQEQVKEIAGAVNVVTREEILRARPKNADEMLRRVPGVNVLDEYGQGLRPNIGIRGMDPRRSRNILLLLDDIPIQPALFGDASTYYMVPIERIDHIEVIKGGATVLYSPNTQGGLINFIQKRIPTIPTFSTTNTFGSFNLFQSDTQYGGYFGNFGAQLGYLRRQSDGFRQRSASQLDDFTLRFEANPDDRTRITTNISWYDETTQTPGSITPTQYRNDRTLAGKPQDEFKGQRGAIDVTASRDIDAHNTAKIVVYGNVFERNWYIQDQNASGTLLSTSTNFLRKFNVFGVMPQHQFRFSLFGLDQKITSGVRYHAERLTDITGIGTAGSKISRTTNNADLESVAYAAYTETAIRLTDALTISPGIRWEQVNQSRETMNAIPPAALPNFKSYKTTQGLIYGTGVKYQLTSDSMLFGHVHTTFRPPTFANAVDPTSGTTQDLSAERALSSDVGLRSILVPGVNAEVAVFRTEFSNQIVQQGSQFVNAGKTLMEGIESTVSLDWGEFVRPLQGFVTRANVTLLRPKSLSSATDGKDLPYAPRMTFYGLVGYYHPTGASIEADALFVAQQFTDGVNTQTENALGTTGAIPSYTIWNLRLNYAPPKARWAVFAGVRNLTDESFIAQRTTGSFIGIQPGEIRNFYGGVSWRF
ncbi:MAG: putative TonB-dependent Iron(III) dicitrate transport protein FecA [Nitrospira sp.]|jgi:Fe(3+) dicitrate transport protein|nr:putative TonB-dependent Iron(III) dicitrate transport protein FecA [Nitrospira sp.]